MKGWKYTFFNDTKITEFFTTHTDPEFPDIQNIFNSFTTGPHKADLFRYFYLYKLGGVFIDSDLMLYDDIENIIGKHSFVSVKAIKPAGSIFNGFLAATPANPTIREALKHLYATKNADLQAKYTLVVEKLGEIVGAHPQGTFLLEEETNNDVFCTIKYPEGHPNAGKVPMIHYQSADIPNIPE
jgi:mannosyltransferase OCH1-like enzyme